MRQFCASLACVIALLIQTTHAQTNKYWAVESAEARQQLPLYQIIPADK
jgi:hypothetical protein